MLLDPFAEASVMKLVAGTAQSVAEQLQSVIRESGMNYMLCVFSFGDLAAQVALRSLRLFTTGVMPRLQ